MPPKRGDRAAAAKAGSKAKSKVKVAPTTALEETAAAEANRKTVGKKTLSVAETVARALRNNFKRFTEHQIDQIRVDGLTLREALTVNFEKVAAKDATAETMGKHFYQLKRDAYDYQDSPAKRLKVLDENEHLHPDVCKALTAIAAHKKDFKLWSTFCEVGPAVNQLTLVTVYRMGLRLAPSTSDGTLGFFEDLMSYIARHKLDIAFPSEFALIKSQLDEACCKSFGRFKEKDYSCKTWWSSKQAWASLVLPLAETDIVVNHPRGEPWISIENELAQVVLSQCGMLIFGSAWRQLVHQRGDAVLDAVIENLCASNITSASLASHYEVFVAKLKVIDIDATESFAKPRQIAMMYRGEKAPCISTSFADAWNVRTAAAIHGLAVDKLMVPPLWCEQQLVSQPRPAVRITIEEPLLAATRLARAAAEEAIPLGQASADAIADVLEKRMAVLCSIDKKFCVEKYFFLSVIGAGAVNRLVAEVGRCLPTEAAPKTIEEVMAGLDKLGQTKLIEFCGLGLQGAFRSAKEFIASIKAGRAPHYSGGDGDSLLTKLVMDQSA